MMRITTIHEESVIALLEAMKDTSVRTVKMATGIVMTYGPTIDQLIKDLNNGSYSPDMAQLSESEAVGAVDDIYTPEYWAGIPEDERTNIIELARSICSIVCQHYIGIHNTKEV